MKKAVYYRVADCLLLSSTMFVSCSKEKQTDPFCDELAAAYMNAGYNVYPNKTNTSVFYPKY